MAVYVQGSGPVPTRVGELDIWLHPAKSTALDWATAMQLVDKRLAHVVGFADDGEFVRTVGASPGIYWLSPFSQGDGYATAAESMVFWLAQHGVRLSVHHSWFLVEEGLRDETLAMLRSPDPTPYQIGVCMATPGEFQFLPTPYRVGFTMYEASNPLQVYPEWRHECNDVDAIFVPSVYCKQLFETFVHVPVHTVPLAIHEGYCRPMLRTKRDKFRVVTFATMTGRKSPIEMVEVFQRAFPKQDDVEFHIKTRLNLVGSQTPGVPDFNDPRVFIHNGTWDWRTMRSFLYEADAMMFLSKGEGFGMTPREAMATGCPTILADNSGMSDVCNSEYNWPVPTKRMEASPLGGEWAIPDWQYAAEVLRSIYKQRDKAYKKAMEGAQWYARVHGPSKAAETFIDALGQLDGKPADHAQGHLVPDDGLIARVWSEACRVLPALLHSKRVVLDDYSNISRIDVNRKVVLLKGSILSQTREQLTFAVNYLLTSGASSIVIVAPSIYLELHNGRTKFWTLEELQYILQNKHVPLFRYVEEHTWILAVATASSGSRMQAYGHVIDRRWKRT